MEPSAEMRIKEMQMRVSEAEAARTKAMKDAKRLHLEIDKLKGNTAANIRG